MEPAYAGPRLAERSASVSQTDREPAAKRIDLVRVDARQQASHRFGGGCYIECCAWHRDAMRGPYDGPTVRTKR